MNYYSGIAPAVNSLLMEVFIFYYFFYNCLLGTALRDE